MNALMSCYVALSSLPHRPPVLPQLSPLIISPHLSCADVDVDVHGSSERQPDYANKYSNGERLQGCQKRPGLWDLSQEMSKRLLEYFETILSQQLTITIHEVDNPFRLYVMPLAREHYGVMQAVLGLAACHLSVSDSVTYRVDVAMEYRGSALNALSSCLAKTERCGLTTTEEDAILAMILLLVLHDICESGMSTEAYHLTGVSHFCGRVAAASESSRRTDASMFFLSALAWLDVLRGFSGAEKLTYSEESSFNT
ncbi:hypothetical protein Cob_v006110 [Colletotrichum orbiculare MAFF 240422]|uniref:C6 transcription factor n=1 Tax=Colletotrichum orbiculare (strain 104-T / ATCC 96160 / CBS 514.97 / LARS 414 / MAFF 240422) TaxID=1213857 RepID=A0A484FSR1_COLOR|nr:hypothetical protein Cob_v006110 [Colletotrichum orbiculare MAFF 240422]